MAAAQGGPLSSPLLQEYGNVLSLVGAGSLGAALVLIHIYVTPLKRFVQALWAVGTVGGLSIVATQVCGCGCLGNVYKGVCWVGCTNPFLAYFHPLFFTIHLLAEDSVASVRGVPSRGHVAGGSLVCCSDRAGIQGMLGCCWAGCFHVCVNLNHTHQIDQSTHQTSVSLSRKGCVMASPNRGCFFLWCRQCV